MQRETWTWKSPSVGREMRLARWGHFGKPVIWFPTGGGDFLDVERFLMVRALQPLVDAGRIKLYACESVSRTWIDPHVASREKTMMQARYDKYLVDELLPFIAADCGGTEQRFAATGCSIGGYDALNAVAKHPDWFDLMVGMSGTYTLDRRIPGHWDEDYYFNNPAQFLPNLPPGEQLDRLRTCLFVLARGGGPHENPEYIERMIPILARKGIPHRAEIWGKDADHDWPTWRTMLPLFLDRLVPSGLAPLIVPSPDL